MGSREREAEGVRRESVPVRIGPNKVLPGELIALIEKIRIMREMGGATFSDIGKELGIKEKRAWHLYARDARHIRMKKRPDKLRCWGIIPKHTRAAICQLQQFNWVRL